MAADLVMPTLPGDQETSRHFLQQRPPHSRSQSYQIPPVPHLSPLSTSVQKAANHYISQPSSPVARRARPAYMPAVLRPNSEFPARKPATPKAGGSDDSDSDSTLRLSNPNSFISIVGFSGISKWNTRDSGKDMGTGMDLNLDLDMFPEVTALPTRRHWKPDPQSRICDDPTCKRNFNYFVRRHHCRRCGNIFCDWHSSLVSPLDQDGNFNPRAGPSRTCNHCFEQFKAWHSRNNSRSSSSASSDVPHTTPTTPISAVHGGVRAMGLSRSPDAAASVPTDWNWSTF